MSKPLFFDVTEYINRLVLTGFSLEDAELIIRIEEDYMVELGIISQRSDEVEQ